MDRDRRDSLVSSILTHAAQLAYVEESRGAFELLSRADRFLRYMDGRNPAAPLADELAALGLYVEIRNLCEPNTVELRSLESDAAGRETALFERGSLADELDRLLASAVREADEGVAVGLFRAADGSYVLSAGSLSVTVVPLPATLSTRTTFSP